MKKKNLSLAVAAALAALTSIGAVPAAFAVESSSVRACNGCSGKKGCNACSGKKGCNACSGKKGCSGCKGK